MDTFTAYLLDREMTFERYGSVVILESFENYTVRQLLPVFLGDKSLTRTYCLISGFVTGYLSEYEIEAMIRSAVWALKLDDLDKQVHISDSNVAAAFEMIFDHVEGRIIETSKAAPSLSFSSGRLAIVGAHWTRQLSVLVSTLLYDAGQFRDKQVAFTDKILRIRKTIELAEYISGLEESPITDELFAALIELDAKYSIRDLQFVRREHDKLNLLRESDVDLNTIRIFALELLAFRDKHLEVVDEGQLWTRELYRQRTFQAVDRQKHSNLWKPAETGHIAGNNISGVKKAGRPADPEVAKRKEAEKQAKRVANKTAGAAAALDLIFGADFFADDKKKA